MLSHWNAHAGLALYTSRLVPLCSSNASSPSVRTDGDGVDCFEMEIFAGFDPSREGDRWVSMGRTVLRWMETWFRAKMWWDVDLLVAPPDFLSFMCDRIEWCMNWLCALIASYRASKLFPRGSGGICYLNQSAAKGLRRNVLASGIEGSRPLLSPCGTLLFRWLLLLLLQ